MPSKKRATTISLQPLDALFGTNEETTNGISEIAIGSLHPFPNLGAYSNYRVKRIFCKEDGILIKILFDGRNLCCKVRLGRGCYIIYNVAASSVLRGRKNHGF